MLIKNYITFIDDYSKYCYVYLISRKSEAFEYFKRYKTEVEKQLGKDIKVLRLIEGENTILQNLTTIVKNAE